MALYFSVIRAIIKKNSQEGYAVPFGKLFRKKSTPDIPPEIQSLKKNSILLNVMKRSNEASRADGCKIGGLPYLPANFVWPTFTSPEDGITRPLSFFCQIDLAEMKPYDTDNVLPEQGLLSFFYECESFRWGFDPADSGAAQVFYFENTDGFIPTNLPDAIAEEHRMPEISLLFQTVPSYPCYEEFSIHSNLKCDWDAYDEARAALGINVDEDPNCHKLLGYADLIQDEMLTECERIARGLYCGDAESFQNTPDDVKADIHSSASEWVLLLQLSTISKRKFEWMFGDCGMLYYFIRKEDLAAKRFDRIHFSVQCG